jgi:hypothetical protein
MRPDETTRWCNDFGERLDAAASIQTELIGWSINSKQTIKAGNRRHQDEEKGGQETKTKCKKTPFW